jgi:hypothetical protein
MGDIVYTYNRDAGDLALTYMNCYYDNFGCMYNHTYRRSIQLESKIAFQKLQPVMEFNDYGITFEKTITSIIRGLNTLAYEDDDEDGFSDVDLSTDYLDHIYMFNNSDKIGICINYNNNGQHYLEMAVTYVEEKSKEAAMRAFNYLDAMLSKYTKIKNTKKRVNFICQSPSGLFLQEMVLKTNINFDIENHYNDDFKEVSDKILASLDKNSKKGIILLHGKHGTGKTTYLRYLINNLEKNIIYVSPDMSSRVSEPSFLTFLLKHKNSILIIEDAENVIKTREAGENQAVSNLLNITDGILGDGLNFQIICTFNTNFDQIDPALKRKGRMIAQYEFKNLTVDKTANLVNHLYGEDAIVPDSEMSLAEIFNMNEDNYDKKVVKQTFGFNR